MSTFRARGPIGRFLLAFAVAVSTVTIAAAPAHAADGPTVGITQTTAPTQASGAPFRYDITYSCSVVAASTCATDAVITVPLGAAAAWPVTLAPDATHVDSYQVTNGNLVINLGNLEPGESAALGLTITPPNHTTPNGTTWSLTPTLSTTDVGSVTSPNTVTSTATADATMGLTKIADSVAYLIGSNATFTITPRCSSTNTGDLNITSATLVDTLPAGLHYVSSSPSGTYDAGTNTVTWTFSQLGTLCNSTQSGNPSPVTLIATVGGQSGDGVVDGSRLNNQAQVTGDKLGGGTTTASATREVRAVAGTIAPGTAVKSGIGPFSNTIGDATTASGNGTYNSGVVSGAPTGQYSVPAAASIYSLTDAARYFQGINATYRLNISGGTGQSTFAITDPMPCTTNNPSAGLYQSNPATGALCQSPAFNPQFVNVTSGDLNGIGPGNEVPAAFVPQAVLLDGTVVPLVQVAISPQVSGPNGPSTRMFRVPTQFVGQVAALTFPAVTGMNSPTSYIEVGGYVSAGFTTGDTIRNIAHVDYFANADPSGPSVDGGNFVGNVYVVDKAQIGIDKFGTASGDDLVWSIGGRLVSPGPAVDDVIITDLLPAGIHFTGYLQGQNVRLFLGGDTSGNNVSFEIAPEVIDNFNGTGRTLLRWTISAAQINQIMPTTGGYVSINVSVPPTAADFPGTYVNQADIFYADGATDHRVCSQNGTPMTVDPADLDGTPNTFHCTDSDSQTVRPAPGSAAQAVTKQVKTGAGSIYTGYPGIGVIPPGGGTATYRLNWTNKGATPLNSVTLYDLLPRPGDTGTVAATRNQPRNSTFQPQLTGLGALPVGVTAYYSTSTNPCRPEVLADADNPGCVNDWTATAPADLSTVLALKFVSTQTYVYDATFSIEVSMTTPPVGADDVAWNTFAAGSVRSTTGAALPPVESTKVGIARPGFAHLNVAKTVDSAEVSGGAPVTYTVRVVNDGQVDLTDVTATDTLPAGVTFVSASGGGTESGGVVSWDIGDLAAGMSRTYTVSVTMPVPDAATEFVNSFTATGTNPSGNPPGVTPENPCSAATDEVSSCATVLVNPLAQLEITKSVDKPTALVGDTLTYTITVENTGSVDIEQALIYDALPVGVTFVSSDPASSPIDVGPDIVLVPFAVDVAAGATTTITVTVTVNAGTEGQTLQNAALGDPGSGIPTIYGNPCVWMTDEFPATCAETVVQAPNPAVSIEKSADKASVSTVGEVITYSFEVTNSGNVTLTDVGVTDTQAAPAGALDGPVICPVTTLEPGASTICTATYTVTQVDLDHGRVDDSAVAHGTPPATPANPDPAPINSGPSEVTVTVNQNSLITLEKSADRLVVDKVGDQVTYSFLVTNASNVALSQVSVTESSFSGSGTMSAITCPATTLAPGASTTCSATYSITQADLESGVITNVAVAHGTPPATGSNPNPVPVDSDPSDAKVISTWQAPPSTSTTPTPSPSPTPTPTSPTSTPTPSSTVSPSAASTSTPSPSATPTSPQTTSTSPEVLGTGSSPTSPPSAAGAPSSDPIPPSLATTGAPVARTLGLGLLLLAAGFVLLMYRRRKDLR